MEPEKSLTPALDNTILERVFKYKKVEIGLDMFLRVGAESCLMGFHFSLVSIIVGFLYFKLTELLI